MEAIAVSSDSAAVDTTTPGGSSSEIDVSAAQPTVVHVSLPNQAVQVQSVIQAAPSVIQAATGQTLQAIQVSAHTNSHLGQPP